MPPVLKAPYPWFGGKARVAPAVWRRFGDVRNYVEPFYGSGAVLLGRPLPFEGMETINDADGFVCNFWRALQAEPAEVARHADWPVNENDLHARHAWLVGRRDGLTSWLEGDPEFYDAKVAGWWAWGQCCWIGRGFCSGDGPWHVADDDGNRQLVHLGDAGRGVKRQLVHLGNAGRGVNRRRVESSDLLHWFEVLAERLRRVRVCCGDWARVCGPTPTVKQGLTAVFLDPPYSAEAGRAGDLYANEDPSVAHDVRAWCLEHGKDKRLRIALCGYEGEHDELQRHGWTVQAWKANGGYGSQSFKHGNPNAKRERAWYSPHCLKPGDRMPLFAGLEDAWSDA